LVSPDVVILGAAAVPACTVVGLVTNVAAPPDVSVITSVPPT